MPKFFDFLASRVGRRLVLLFGVCALIPLFSLAGLSYRAIGNYLLSAGHSELRAGSKSYAMSLMDRLQQLESTLQDTAALLADGELSRTRREMLESRFDWVGLVSRADSVETLIGEAENAPGQVQLDRLVVGDRRAAIQPREQPLLALPLSADEPDGKLLVARLRSTQIWWGATEGDTMPATTLLLVQSGDTVLFSTLPQPEILAGRVSAAQRGVDGHHLGALEWGEGDLEAVAGFWTLPLSLQFSGEDWTVVWSRSRDEVLRPVRQFALTFALVLTATFLGVILLALWQIRRFLRPLEALRRGTARLADQDFSATVQLSSRDEFGDLAHAFNDMAGHVGQMVDDLRRHQLGTLRSLAQAIDERSSWTLGHSGRVAGLSQRIAAEMAVPAEEMATLYRAALLHDIGKLKLSTSLLEKPGVLTPAEFEVIKEHVDAGVRILAPIPEYSAICEIVAQHHERLDGSGYPRGLKGNEIGLGALIVAVADSFDALSCDRPYRVGLSLDGVLSEIHRCTGTLFDPAVVKALNVVVRQGGLEATAQLEMRTAR